ncbi:hypothetical protein ACLK2F_21430 [Escherichia coli]
MKTLLLEAYSWEYQSPAAGGERYQTAFARRRDCIVWFLIHTA